MSENQDIMRGYQTYAAREAQSCCSTRKKNIEATWRRWYCLVHAWASVGLGRQAGDQK